MKIKKIIINNYRLFASGKEFVIDGINIPNNNEKGSGLTVFVGENACGRLPFLTL